MSYVPQFIGLFSKHERVNTIRPLYEQYEKFENSGHARGMFETTQEFYENLSNDSSFIQEGDSKFYTFLNTLAPLFNKSIKERKERKAVAMKKVSYFLEMIKDNDLLDKKQNNKILNEFNSLYNKIEEENNPDTRSIEIRLISDAFYTEFVNKLTAKLPGDMEFFTVNRGGLDHMSFIDSFKINRLSRGENESLCSPKKDFMPEVSSGNINGGSVSCKKCIKSLISLVAEPNKKLKHQP